MREANTILVCHSDEATLTFLADNLSADRYETHIATAAKEARLKLEHRALDLVICGPLETAADQLGAPTEPVPRRNAKPLVYLRRAAANSSKAAGLKEPPVARA